MSLSLLTSVGRFLAPVAQRALAQRVTRVPAGAGLAGGAAIGAGLASLPPLPRGQAMTNAQRQALGMPKKRRARGFSARDIQQTKKFIKLAHDVCKKTKRR